MAPGALWVKRDDATGLAGGGNKARKLEYLCADALEQGCDCLVTGGGAQSNHVRMTAAAANRLGLGCTIVIAADRPDVPSGNLLLDELMAPEIIWAGSAGGPLDYYAIEGLIADACDRLVAAGRRPYRIPIGGASAVGALGYVRAALELMNQDADFELAVVADGSGGTHAGLAAGFGDHGRVLGIDVGARPDLDRQVPAKAAEVAGMAGLPEPSGAGALFHPGGAVDQRQIGSAYGAVTDSCREAVDMAARLEGMVLDPVYTGKAMAGLIAARREGRIGRHVKVVFFHTGGLPALFATPYAAWVRGEIVSPERADG